MEEFILLQPRDSANQLVVEMQMNHKNTANPKEDMKREKIKYRCERK